LLFLAGKEETVETSDPVVLTFAITMKGGSVKPKV